MRFLTIPEAAKLACVNVKTMRKHVKEGRVPSVETPLGLRISEDALTVYGPRETNEDQSIVNHPGPEETIVPGPAWTGLRQDSPIEATVEDPEWTIVDQNEPGQWEMDGPECTVVDQGAPARTSWKSPNQSSPDHNRPSGSSEPVPLAAHIAALEFAERRLAEERARSFQALLEKEAAQLRAEQAERGKLAIEGQLAQYQRVLSEQAESLAEERAKRMTAEARVSVESEPGLPLLENLKTSSPEKRGWRQRLQGWFGARKAQG